MNIPISMTQISSNLNFNKINRNTFILLQETKNRLLRMIWAFLLVLLISAICFVLVKSSIDWVNIFIIQAQNSKQELNKMKDNRLRAIADDINRKYSFIRTEC